MTQTQRELLFKDLCSRLPYGVFVNIKDIKCVLQPHDISDLIKCDAEVKPYLFPLSSMTEEQKTYISNRWGINEDFNFEINSDWGKYFVDLGDARDFIDWLNENHFDYRGLIYEELAIDCTTLNIY